VDTFPSAGPAWARLAPCASFPTLWPLWAGAGKGLRNVLISSGKMVIYPELMAIFSGKTDFFRKK